MTDDFIDCPLPETISGSGGLWGAIASSMAKWARKPADLYPTPKDCTYSLVPHIRDLLPKGSSILEPACAEGQMSTALEECGYRVVSTDLRPEVGYGEGGVDFLDRDNHTFHADVFDAVITNPPFTCAADFIRRSLEIAPVAVMLLKAQYFHTLNRRALWRESGVTRQLMMTWRPAFLQEERGKSPVMDCSWFVFMRGHEGGCTSYPIERILHPMLVDEDAFDGL